MTEKQNALLVQKIKLPKLFNSKEQVLDLIEKADPHKESEILILKFRELQKHRIPFFLTVDELEEIFKWKLRGQFHRQTAIRKRNSPQNVILLTQTAFAIEHKDEKYETELKIKILTALSGVEIPVASAILTLCFPSLYAVIDFKNWRQIYGPDKKPSYTTKTYNDYLSTIRGYALEFDLTPQEIDMAIWQLDNN